MKRNTVLYFPLLLMIMYVISGIAETSDKTYLTNYTVMQSSDNVSFEPMCFNAFPFDSHPMYYVIIDNLGNMLFDPIPFCITREGVEEVWCENNKFFVERFWYSDDSGFCRTALIIEPLGVFTGFIFGEVFGFSEGRAAACRYEESGGYGYIGIDGEFIIPDIWEWAESFSNGRAVVSYRTALGYRNLIINMDGEVIGIVP